MKCPFCGYHDSKVVDSRPSEDYVSIRRRRECLSCKKRFTTFEVMETLPIIVIKKDGSRQDAAAVSAKVIPDKGHQHHQAEETIYDGGDARQKVDGRLQNPVRPLGAVFGKKDSRQNPDRDADDEGAGGDVNAAQNHGQNAKGGGDVLRRPVFP